MRIIRAILRIDLTAVIFATALPFAAPLPDTASINFSRPAVVTRFGVATAAVVTFLGVPVTVGVVTVYAAKALSCPSCRPPV